MGKKSRMEAENAEAGERVIKNGLKRAEMYFRREVF